MGDLARRVNGWYVAGEGKFENFDALIIRGVPIELSNASAPTKSALEAERYCATLRRMGVESLSQAVLLLRVGSVNQVGHGCILHDDGPHDNLWLDDDFLRNTVQSSLPATHKNDK